MSKFVRYLYEGTPRWGMVNKDGKFLEIEGDRFTQYTVTDKVIEPESVKILPPSEPTKIVAIGLNYRDHAKELNMELPKEPLMFIKTPNAVTSHNSDIIYPAQSERVDYEAELAIIIKNDIKDINEKEAEKNILGYTCLNDITARDLQKKDGQWTRAKCFDTFAPFGPYVTRDIDPDNAPIKMRVNGEVKQDSNTSNFIFKTYELVAYVSKVMTLKRGDIITTGTPPGIGPVKKGDVLEVEVEGIGVLKNTVV